MNRLSIEKQAQIISLLVEGNSLRSTSRIADCSINTVTKLLVEVGKACAQFHNDTVLSLQSKRIQLDEIWSFVYAKERNLPEALKEKEGVGDVWTWTAIDADSKLIISWLVGNHSREAAEIFLKDVAIRLAGQRVQMTSDGYSAYIDAVSNNFMGNVDFAQIIKIFGGTNDPRSSGKYSPPECIGTKKTTVIGNPDKKHISTSFVERQNLTMRMHMRRFTRLTNAFSKKIENHCHAIALHFVYYNFVKIHKTLRVTPAMEAGIASRPMEIVDIVNLVNQN